MGTTRTIIMITVAFAISDTLVSSGWLTVQYSTILFGDTTLERAGVTCFT